MTDNSASLEKPEPPKRTMRLPRNSAYPNFNETHLEDDWCPKAGCVPVCSGEAQPGPPIAPDPQREAFERECQAGIARKDPAWLYIAKTFNFTLPAPSSSPLETPRKRFRVLTPSGVIADGFWERREDIPARIPDRGNHYFDTDDAEIIEEIVPAESSPKPAESPIDRAHAEDLIEELDRSGLNPNTVIKHFLFWEKLRATPSPEPPRQTADIAPKCDCYAMFGQPHFHDCPAAIAKKEASMHEAIKHVPPQYLKERLSFDYSEKRNLYEITGGGYVLAETEDSEIADAICKMFNKAREASPEPPRQTQEEMPLVCLHTIPLDYHCPKCSKESNGGNRRIVARAEWQKKYEACLQAYNKIINAPSSHSEPELVETLQNHVIALSSALREIDGMLDGGLPITHQVKSIARAALASTPQNEQK